MPTIMDNTYRRYLLPKRLVFFDLDGTIIPSTHASGRRIAIAIYAYEKLKKVAKENFGIDHLPDLDHEQCSQLHREHSGPLGLIRHVLHNNDLTAEVKDCLSDYFNGLFKRRLEEYNREDLKYDIVPESYLEFIQSLTNIASLVLVSYRYQPQRNFLASLEDAGLTINELFGAHNAFSVGGPSSSADGSKARFVGKMWRREIRAQRRLTSNTGKTFPPYMIGDSIRDLHFAADAGGIFLGISETGVDSRVALINEMKELGNDLDSRSQIFSSIADPELQGILRLECEAYIETLNRLSEEKIPSQ